MSDEKIIDFKDLKNKVKDSDVDKFEQYMYNLYFSVMEGNLTMTDFSKKILSYMQENDISHEKFINIQKKFMERYGMDSSEIDKQLKQFGIDSSSLDNISVDDMNKLNKSLGFYEKYSSSITAKNIVTLSICNDINDVIINIEQEKVTIYSKKNINLMDSELNEFLLSYKNMFNKKLSVILCENYTAYEY